MGGNAENLTGFFKFLIRAWTGLRKMNGVIDGAKTRDNQNHNLGLYQLDLHQPGPFPDMTWLKENYYFLEYSYISLKHAKQNPVKVDKEWAPM
jgi:hypothetical protein